jgi:metal-responsive CopG/Arc/MetJ family transcriptional regulator
MRKKYTNVAIPEELAKEIDKVISASKLGYTSRAQFVLESIRDKIVKTKK